MKVFQINTVSGWGSTGRIVTDLAETINRAGHECFIAYGQKQSHYEKSYKIGSRIENNIHNLGSRLFDAQGYFTRNGTKRLTRYISEINPDVIHLHNVHGNYLNIEILFKYLASIRTPVVWTLHDCWPFTGHCAYFDYVNCNKWETLCFSCPNKKAYPPSIIIDNSRRNYLFKKELFNLLNPKLALVTPSIWLSQRIGNSFLRQNSTVVINNGIDLNIFRKRDASRLKNKFKIEDECVILGVSSDGFTGRKGLEYFTEMSKNLGNEFKILLVGTTKQDNKHLNDRIISIKRTQDPAELAELYSLADLFVNPTLEDNFPTTNLESLACGTPVITFNTGGSPEALDYDSGRIVKKADTNALIKTVLEMGKKFKREHSDQCRRRATDFYDKDSRYADYLHLYCEMIERNG